MCTRTPEVSLSTSRISTIRRTCEMSLSRTMVQVKHEESDDDFSFGETIFDNPEDSIKRFIEIGDFDSAVYWIDNAYAKATDFDVSKDAVKFAKYLKLLTSSQQWLRVSSMMEAGEKFYTQHIVFAYFYVNALFRQKLYQQVISTQIGHLIEVEDTPVKAPVIVNGMDASLCGDDITMNADQKIELDHMADALSLQSAILVILGQTFLFLENRDAAAKCLRRALLKDRHCIKAEQLLLQYKLLEISDEIQLKRLSQIRQPLESERDPRIMTSNAKALYARGDPKGAIGITNNILRANGWYMDCLIVHVNSLVLLEDSDALYTFAHQMVDAMPDHEYSWYAVGLYYYTCKNMAGAKNYMNKATVMNSGFGDGWLALGHILAADSDNDQALSCYYRAARIMEKNFEPSLYIAMQYCKNGVKLAESFLKDACRIAPDNPIVYQEQGCIAYNKKDFCGAMHLFEKALKLVIVDEDATRFKEFAESAHSYLSRRNHPIDAFWAPLLNNLGHACRRIGYYEQAKVYHQTALLIQPRNSQALCSSAMILFATGNHRQAIQQVHRALSMSPYDDSIRAALESMVQMNAEMTKPSILDDGWDQMSQEDLEDLLTLKTPQQTDAQQKAQVFLKKSAEKTPIVRKLRNRVIVDQDATME